MKMVKINKLLFVVVAFCVNIGKADAGKKLFLFVYYESKCPDSMHFITEQLQPAISLLHDHIILKLVPFGKASSINEKDFKCQHGPSECLGNIIQDCALDLMRGRSDEEKVDYVACEMETYAASNGVMQCVEKYDISVEEVVQCATSNHGISLQLASEHLTKAVNPSFIPTVTIDGIFNQRVQTRSQQDLIGTLCSYLEGTRPCDSYYNDVNLRYYLL